ncbi:MAG: GGDEF domain-containing protein [Planctomycetota bacterium]
MQSVWLDTIIAVSCAGVGFVCGWLMHALQRSFLGSQAELISPLAEPPKELSDAGDATSAGNAIVVQPLPQRPMARVSQQSSRDRIGRVAARLRLFATSMAADVDEHQNRMQRVNNSLKEHTDTSEETPDGVMSSINELVDANALMQQKLNRAQERIEQQASQLETAERRAQTDSLTLVSNRRAFDQYLTQCHTLGPGKSGALAMVDVDHFKKFNDVYGHRAGDEVLRVVAGLLNSRLQPHGMVARFGGEEFAILLDPESPEESLEKIEETRQAIGQHEIIFEDQCLRVTTCVGIAFLQPGEAMDSWLQRADDALYHSKDNGRNCGHWMDGDVPKYIGNRANKKPADTNFTSSLAAAASTATKSFGKDATASTQSTRAAGDSNARSLDQELNDCLPKKPTSGVFAYLPDCEELRDELSAIQGRGTDSLETTQLMSVRFNGEPSGFKMRSLLQVVRASARNVDRIGCADDHSLLLILPGIDETAARARGKQICAAAKSLRLSSSDEHVRHPVTITVANAAPASEFAATVRTMLQLSEDAARDSDTPIHSSKPTVGA